jgi:FtsP/CotA-like multicopper oxidase with cupredoxin domain
MNGFDTNFDRSNEIYAVNTVAFEYMERPVRVKRGERVRIYLVNALEFDLLNSFHIHANFFDYYPTGTRLEPRDFTDTVVLGQGERGILEVSFPYAGKYMFHAHVSEFAELGWMGFFEVTE